jgi:PAS domain S-box-containing protein
MNMLIESNAIDKIDVYAKQQTPPDEQLVERYSPPALLLDADGFIQACNKSVEELFGYRQHELVLHHISRLFPKLTEVSLMQGTRLNPLFNYICHCDHVFKALNKQSDIITCNLNFLLVENKGKLNLRLIVRPVANVQS